MISIREGLILVMSAIIFNSCEKGETGKKDTIEYGELDTLHNRKAYREYQRWGFVNKNNEVIIYAKYDSVFSFNENRCVVSNDKKYGVIDTMGKLIIPYKYELISKFKDGYAIVAIKEWDDIEREHHWKYGIIKADGELFTEIVYENPRFFREGLLAYRLEVENKKYYEEREQLEKYKSLAKLVKPTVTHWGYINKEGEIKIKPRNYYEIEMTRGRKEFSWGRTYFYTDMYLIKDWMAYINSIIDGITMQEQPVDDFREGYALISAMYCGWIDRTGKFVIPMKYDDAKYFTEGLAAVKIKGKWGYINTKGKEVINYTYDDAEQFNEGIAGISKKGLWGYINKEGKAITPIKYDKVRHFINGFGEAELGNVKIKINKNGEEVEI